MKKVIISVIAVLILVAVVFAGCSSANTEAGENLLFNGNFESGLTNGWTIIKDSSSFSFRSEKAERFIEPVNPLFILSCSNPTVTTAPDEESYTDTLTTTLEAEVCSLVNIEVSKYAKEFLASEKAKFLSETDGEFITHNTFSIIGSQNDNIVYLRLLTF